MEALNEELDLLKIEIVDLSGADETNIHKGRARAITELIASLKHDGYIIENAKKEEP